MRNQEFNVTEKNSDKDFLLPDNPTEENAECDEIDKELKKIFDDLRLVGSPRKYSLADVLTEAIDAEKALLRNKAESSGEGAPKGSPGRGIDFATKQIFNNLRPFRVMYTTVGTAALGVILCLCFLASISVAKNDENSVAKNSRFLHAENR